MNQRPIKQVTLAVLLLLCSQTLAIAAAKPNIVMILFDDLGDVKDPSSRKIPGHEMLFNLADDPREQHDLTGSQPAKLSELKKLYQAWSDKVDADAATFKR